MANLKQLKHYGGGHHLVGPLRECSGIVHENPVLLSMPSCSMISFLGFWRSNKIHWWQVSPKNPTKFGWQPSKLQDKQKTKNSNGNKTSNSNSKRAIRGRPRGHPWLGVVDPLATVAAAV